MHYSLSLILDSVGLDTEICPNCLMDNWQYSGTGGQGITSVQCATCGRCYVEMSGFEEIAHICGKLGQYALLRSSDDITAYYSRLVSTYASCGMGRWEQRRMVLVYTGEDMDGGDDAPF